ncbi:STAR7-like protein, partial [Mya arenaria]
MFAKWNTLSSLAGGAWKSQCMKFMQDQMTMLKAVGLQCNMIAAHRVKRTLQIVQLYRNLYGKKSPAQFLEKLSSLVKANPQEKMLFLLGAAFFDWKGNRVSETDMTRIEEDLRPFFDHKIADTPFHDKSGDVWELVFNKESFKLWRCPVPVHGSYKDIPATAFFNIQLDLDYRKQWDRHIVQLEKVAEDQETGSEIVYWATHFPLGILYDRDYLYVRRYKNYMMLMAKSVQHPQFPETKQFVRVAEYSSQMVIRPHSKFEENGFDYVMSYYDNPHL